MLTHPEKFSLDLYLLRGLSRYIDRARYEGRHEIRYLPIKLSKRYAGKQAFNLAMPYVNI